MLRATLKPCYYYEFEARLNVINPILDSIRSTIMTVHKPYANNEYRIIGGCTEWIIGRVPEFLDIDIFISTCLEKDIEFIQIET